MSSKNVLFLKTLSLNEIKIQMEVNVKEKNLFQCVTQRCKLISEMDYPMFFTHSFYYWFSTNRTTCLWFSPSVHLNNLSWRKIVLKTLLFHTQTSNSSAHMFLPTSFSLVSCIFKNLLMAMIIFCAHTDERTSSATTFW